MEQQQLKIRISLTSKLLMLISVLLTVLIAVLNVSAIKLFFNDKKAYIYDTQATASMLAGREFTAYLQNSIDTLKLELGSADLSKTIDGGLRNSLQYIIDNQRSLLGVELVSLNTQSGSVTKLFKYFAPKNMEGTDLKEEDFAFKTEAVMKVADQLSTGNIVYKNISKSGQTPLLAIMFGDNSMLSSKGFTSVAIGYLSLKQYYLGSSQMMNRLIIIDSSGGLLLHSDIKEMYANANYAADAIFQEAKSAQTISGAKEYTTQDGVKMLASYFKPGLNLTTLTQIEYDKAMRATYTMTEKFVVLAIGMLGFMILAGLLFSKKITAPLQRLYVATDQVAQGNFEVQLPVTSTDEIGVLTNAFMTMSRKITELFQQMLDKMRLDQELQIAKTVQQSLFPEAIIANENILVASAYQSATECGGDWWGYFKNGNKHVLAIADATGHGLPSALMTASARACFSVIEKMSTNSGGVTLTPSEMLSLANRVVYDSAQGKIMMTYFIAIFDFSNHTLSFASAAHNPPWLFSPQADGTHKMSSLIANGQRLGETRDAVNYETKEVPFSARDTIVFYTDGLLEGKNLEGTQYGKKQARKVLEAAMSAQPMEVLNTLMGDFLQYNEGKVLDDDVTLAVARILS